MNYKGQLRAAMIGFGIATVVGACSDFHGVMHGVAGVGAIVTSVMSIVLTFE